MPKADRIWESLRCDEAVVATLSHELRVSPVTARLLSIRGLDDPLSARRFLFPSLDDLLDPHRLTDLPAAVDRILRAIANDDGPRDHLIALGYAGWAAGQLEQELAENSWLTLPGSSDVIFSTPVEQRLGAAAALLGIDMNLISGDAGHA